MILPRNAFSALRHRTALSAAETLGRGAVNVWIAFRPFILLRRAALETLFCIVVTPSLSDRSDAAKIAAAASG
ncbi:MAG: hypothetical protein ABJI96_14265 [Paracoccaceae bacterium]